MATYTSGEQADPARPAILIVDDEPAITRTLARRLRDRFSVFTASSADAALDIIAREPIAVILTDQRMPDLSGIELLDRARALRPEAVGILISGYTDASALVDALNLGNVRGFIPKPWDINQLRHQLNEAMRSYQVGFLDPTVLHNAADAATQARAQVAELRRTLDAIIEGDTSTLFAQWERTRRDVRDSPGPTASQPPFFEGPPAGDTPIAQRLPEFFAELITTYAAILEDAVALRAHGSEPGLSDRLRAFGESLGASWATPRDVVEIHLASLKRRVTDAPISRIVAYTEEARMLLPELMGDLVVFYRGWLAAAFTRPGPPAPRGPDSPVAHL
jgi:response regulator RpfG family c-di-GMP phosphodiesterase